MLMKTVFLTLALAGACLAQEWELGAGGGLAVYKNATVKRGSESADAGFKPGPVFSAFAAQNLNDWIGGEIRYTFHFSDLKVSAGGQEAVFSGQSHAFHYDVLFYGAGRAARVRPFVLVGGGGKLYRGTGKETAEAPVNAQFALLTRTSEIKGLLVAGGGVRVEVGRNTFLRLEVRDYITPAPKDVIAAVPGAKLSGWIHGFTPMLSLSFGF
jgi:hypothetical protein